MTRRCLAVGSFEFQNTLRIEQRRKKVNKLKNTTIGEGKYSNLILSLSDAICACKRK